MKTQEQFLQQYESSVDAIARQYLRIGEPLEDMLQDGRIGVLWAFANLHLCTAANPDKWVRTIIRRHITQSLREHGYTVQVPRRQAEETNHRPVLPIDECPQVQDIIDDAQPRYQRLYEAIDQLPEAQRRIILLRFGLDGNPAMRSQQVADHLGISQNAVQHIRRYALDNLQAQLS